MLNDKIKKNVFCFIFRRTKKNCAWGWIISKTIICMLYYFMVYKVFNKQQEYVVFFAMFHYGKITICGTGKMLKSSLKKKIEFFLLFTFFC